MSVTVYFSNSSDILPDAMPKELCPECIGIKVCKLERSARTWRGAGLSFNQVSELAEMTSLTDCPIRDALIEDPEKALSGQFVSSVKTARQMLSIPSEEPRKTKPLPEPKPLGLPGPYEPSTSMHQNLPPAYMIDIYTTILRELVSKHEGTELSDDEIRDVIDTQVLEYARTNPLTGSEILSLFHYEKVGLKLVARNQLHLGTIHQIAAETDDTDTSGVLFDAESDS